MAWGLSWLCHNLSVTTTHPWSIWASISSMVEEWSKGSFISTLMTMQGKKLFSFPTLSRATQRAVGRRKAQAGQCSALVLSRFPVFCLVRLFMAGEGIPSHWAAIVWEQGRQAQLQHRKLSWCIENATDIVMSQREVTAPDILDGRIKGFLR